MVAAVTYYQASPCELDYYKELYTGETGEVSILLVIYKPREDGLNKVGFQPIRAYTNTVCKKTTWLDSQYGFDFRHYIQDSKIMGSLPVQSFESITLTDQIDVQALTKPIPHANFTFKMDGIDSTSLKSDVDAILTDISDKYFAVFVSTLDDPGEMYDNSTGEPRYGYFELPFKERFVNMKRFGLYKVVETDFNYNNYVFSCSGESFLFNTLDSTPLFTGKAYPRRRQKTNSTSYFGVRQLLADNLVPNDSYRTGLYGGAGAHWYYLFNIDFPQIGSLYGNYYLMPNLVNRSNGSVKNPLQKDYTNPILSSNPYLDNYIQTQRPGFYDNLDSSGDYKFRLVDLNFQKVGESWYEALNAARMINSIQFIPRYVDERSSDWWMFVGRNVSRFMFIDSLLPEYQRNNGEYYKPIIPYTYDIDYRIVHKDSIELSDVSFEKYDYFKTYGYFNDGDNFKRLDGNVGYEAFPLPNLPQFTSNVDIATDTPVTPSWSNIGPKDTINGLEVIATIPVTPGVLYDEWRIELWGWNQDENTGIESSPEFIGITKLKNNSYPHTQSLSSFFYTEPMLYDGFLKVPKVIYNNNYLQSAKFNRRELRVKIIEPRTFYLPVSNTMAGKDINESSNEVKTGDKILDSHHFCQEQLCSISMSNPPVTPWWEDSHSSYSPLKYVNMDYGLIDFQNTALVKKPLYNVKWRMMDDPNLRVGSPVRLAIQNQFVWVYIYKQTRQYSSRGYLECEGYAVWETGISSISKFEVRSLGFTYGLVIRLPYRRTFTVSSSIFELIPEEFITNIYFTGSGLHKVLLESKVEQREVGQRIMDYNFSYNTLGTPLEGLTSDQQRAGKFEVETIWGNNYKETHVL